MTTLLALPGSWIPKAHTAIAYSAFLTALAIGYLSGLWKELCVNSVAAWPVEWFPSVSATIGDHPPPRAPFQILIALCATPRFLLILLQWIVHRSRTSTPSISSHPETTSTSTARAESNGMRSRGRTEKTEVPGEGVPELEKLDGSGSADVEAIIGIIRTFCCGGWVYITSRDHHDLHDLFMILYLVLTLPWMYFSTSNSTTSQSKARRRIFAAGFLGTILPLIWLYYRHSVMRIPGAYTYYSMMEWSLVVWDVAFDSVTALELSNIQLRIVDTARREDNDTTGSGLFLASSPAGAPQKNAAIDEWSNIDHKSTISYGRAALAWLSDVYLAMCFWTVFTSLGVQLFYWSVWKLALAGSELALLSNLSGYVMAWPSGYSYVTSRQGLIYNQWVMVLAGMGCYILPSPALRLLGVSVGTWAGWMGVFAHPSRIKGSPEIITEAKTLGMGLILNLILKYINYSTNPFWCIVDWNSGGWNITGLIFGLLALTELAYRPTALFPASLTAEDILKKNDIPYKALKVPSTVEQYIVAVGLGGLIHMIQTFLTDAGTIISWTWTGYPISGPTLHPFAGVIITAISLSLAFAEYIPVFSSPFAGLGIASMTLLYSYQDWIAFIGGIGITFYLSTLLPHFLRGASSCSPAFTFGTALLVNNILDVVSVITTAYAFVPYGHLLRERTDLVLGFSMTSIVLAGFVIGRMDLPGKNRLPLRSALRMEWAKRWTALLAVGLSIVALVIGIWKVPKDKPVPYYPDEKMFTAGIWTVHFGVDEGGRDSQRRMMELIKDMQVDVLGLLETDLHRFVYGNRDLTRVIAEELGYFVDLGPGPNKHTWGAALLSKFPIITSTHHLLPSPHGELAPAIFATLDVHGQRVDVMVSHNGQEEDALDRELQTTEIARLLSQDETVPSVFLGYLVTHLGDQRPWPYQILMEDGKMNDIEIEDRWRWCEYIAFRGLWRIAFARVDEGDISDTELQVGRFLLPLEGRPVVYENDKEKYWHIGEGDSPKAWHLPSIFRGNGTRGHTYRVWDGPLYYLPPERSGLRPPV